ncbi:MAG TPA: hypothetical protein VF610_09355, partial [Segetibacter sp.]
MKVLLISRRLVLSFFFGDQHLFTIASSLRRNTFDGKSFIDLFPFFTSKRTSIYFAGVRLLNVKFSRL